MSFDPEEYDEWYQRHYDIYSAELSAVRKFTDLYSNPRLEVGVGTGRFSGPLGIEYGLDPDARMLEFAKKRGVKTILGYAENMPFPNDYFEMVLVCTSLSFFSDPKMAVKEIHRILKREGGFVLAFIPKNSYFGKKYENLKIGGDKRFKNARFYEFSEVIEILKNYFKILDVVSTLIGETMDTAVLSGYIPSANFVVIHSKKV